MLQNLFSYMKKKFLIDSQVKISVRNYWYDRFWQKLLLFLQGDTVRFTIGPSLIGMCLISSFLHELQVIFGLIMYTYSDLTYNRTYYYPDWAIAIGWLMACSSIIMIPIIMVARIIRAEGSLPEVRSLPQFSFQLFLPANEHGYCKIYKYQSHFKEQWKNSNVARFSLIWNVIL